MCTPWTATATAGACTTRSDTTWRISGTRSSLFCGTSSGEPACLLGHSSGGLIAAYAASRSDLCCALVLEDPPFFSCQGERRKQSFNYVDLSTVCHEFLR